MEKLVNDNTLYKGKHHLTRTTRVRLENALRCAIRVRSKQYSQKKLDRTTAVKKLKAGITNSAYHIFGQNKDCSDFCKAKTQSEEKQTSSDNQNETSCDSSENTTKLIDEQNDFWKEGTSISSQEEARNGTTIDYHNVEQHIIKDVLLLLCKIAEKSVRLINNSTTNLAECWMHIRTKFDGGKVHNLCNRGSWHARCYGGALRAAN